jgi:hypothetical protein
MKRANRKLTSKRWPIGIFFGIITLFSVSGGVLIMKHKSYAQLSEQRSNKVNKLGSQVMPFDLKRTIHTFTSNINGGTQTVTANNPSDSEQIRLIQLHLQKESKKFAKGDFSDPATIHGAGMPGLAELKKGSNRINVQYESISNGARLRYSSSDSQLIMALHKWFGAQNTDHNGHHGMHH